MITITEIEDAIIEELKSEISYLKTCGSIGEFEVDEIEELLVQCPAAYVMYDGGDFEEGAGEALDRDMTFSVIVVAKNVRGGDEARHGKGSEKGAYDMIEDVRAALTGNSCGLDITGLLPDREEAIAGDKEIAVYGIKFRTRCEES